MKEYGLLVACSLSPVISGRIMIQVLNPSPAPVMVSKNGSIGTVKPIQEFCCKVCSAGLQEERNNLVEERIVRMLEKAVTLWDKERQQAKELLGCLLDRSLNSPDPSHYQLQEVMTSQLYESIEEHIT